MSSSASDGNALSIRLEAVIKQVLDIIDALPDWVWNEDVEIEEKSVGALLHHIGWALENEAAEFQKIARGEEIDGWAHDWLDATNREQAEIHRHDAPEQVRQYLREVARTTAEFVRQLSSEELNRTGRHIRGEPARSAAEWIDACLIGHPLGHLAQMVDLVDSSGSASVAPESRAMPRVERSGPS